MPKQAAAKGKSKGSKGKSAKSKGKDEEQRRREQSDAALDYAIFGTGPLRDEFLEYSSGRIAIDIFMVQRIGRLGPGQCQPSDPHQDVAAGRRVRR